VQRREVKREMLAPRKRAPRLFVRVYEDEPAPHGDLGGRSHDLRTESGSTYCKEGV